MNEENQKPQTEPQKEPVKEVHHYHHRSNLFGRLFWGMFIVLLGLSFLAQNLGILPDLDVWGFFSVVWPVFIILAGLSIFSKGGILAKTLSIVSMIVIMLLLFAFLIGGSFLGWRNLDDLVGVRDELSENKIQEISIEREPLANAAELRVHFGAGELGISGGSQKLAEGALVSNFSEIRIQNALDGTIQRASIEPNGNFHGFNRYSNKLDLKLSETLPLDLVIDAGASDIDLDLRELNLMALELRAGASSIDLKLGSKAAQNEVSISTGASSIDLSLPREAGVRIETQGGLSSRNIIGLDRVSDNVWKSEDYDSAAKKINIEISAGVSSVNVNRE